MDSSNRSPLDKPFLGSSDASARSTRAFQFASLPTLAAAFLAGVGCVLLVAGQDAQQGKTSAALRHSELAQVFVAPVKEVSAAELEVIEFDYVIVGAGSAGSVLAERLSKLNATVAVIEQGFPVPSGMADRMPGVRQIIQTACTVFNDCGIGSGVGHGLLDSSGAYTHPGGAFQERFAMGGTSSISVGAHFRGGDAYWGSIAKDFGQHWALSEDQTVALERELHVKRPAGDHMVASVLNATASRATGFAPDVFVIPQYNGGSDGLYQNSYTAFLEKATSRKNLHVLSNMYVDRVKIQDGRATGVIAQRTFANGLRGSEYLVGARREVLLAAGAVGSAALLRRSSPTLSELVRPLRDQALITLAWHCGACNVTHEVLQTVKALHHAHGDKNLVEQLQSRDVMYGHGLVMTLAGQKVLVVGRVVMCWACAPGVHGDQLEMNIVLLQPNSFEFEVSADGKLSDVDRLTHEDDIRAGVEGARLVKAAVQSLPEYKQLQLTPAGRFHEDPEKDLRVGGGIFSFFGGTATCRLGDVVDGELKVKGVRGLRAADASVLPEPPAGRPYFSIVKVAHVAAQLAMRDAMSK